MASAYEISFKHEILNEFIASVGGFISRNYVYNDDKIPSDISALENEVWDISRKISLEEDMITLEKYDRRLSEIRDYVYDRTPQPHK